MKRTSAAKNNYHSPKKLVYVRSLGEIPDFKSEDEVAAWYQTHSTVLIQDQLEAMPASVGGKLRARLAARRGHLRRQSKSPRHPRSAQA